MKSFAIFALLFSSISISYADNCNNLKDKVESVQPIQAKGSSVIEDVAVIMINVDPSKEESDYSNISSQRGKTNPADWWRKNTSLNKSSYSKPKTNAVNVCTANLYANSGDTCTLYSTTSY
jgi:hypothetical protein